MFSFSKSLKGNRVNLFSGERQFRNNIRERGGDFSVGKRLAHGGIVSRRRSQISSPDSFVDAGRARAIESKGFPVCCSSIGEQSLRRIPIRFQSLGNAFIAFLYFSFPFLPSFLFAREIFLESKPLLFWQHPNFRPPSMKRRTKKFLARERRERFATWHFTPSSRRLLFRRSFSFLFFFFETTEI